MRNKTREKDAPAEASANTLAVQQNWADRDFLTSVQLGVSQLSAFLNDFGARARPAPRESALRACAFGPLTT